MAAVDLLPLPSPDRSDANAIRSNMRTAWENFKRIKNHFYTYNVKDYGAKGDDVANDAAKINLAIVAANAAGGGIVWFPKGTYFIGTTTIDLLSNVKIQGLGPGKSVLRCTDAGAYGALTKILSIASSVSVVGIQDISLTCTTMTTNGTTGIFLAGSTVKIQNVEVLNLKIGILGKPTSRYVDIREYKQSSTTAAAGFGILASGVQDWTMDGITFTGASTSIGIDKPCSFQNGGTVYGCQRIKISNYTSSYSVGYGLGGNPDDFYPDLTATYPNPNPAWTMFFKGPTGVVAGDIGKTIVQGATTIGVLLAYDDTVIPARWSYSKTNNPAADTATTITTGTGAGVTIISGHRMKAPAVFGGTWTGIDSNNALNYTPGIGHGVSMDACFDTHLSDFNCNYNARAGVYVGDELSLGSSVANGSGLFNETGLTAAGSALTSIGGCNFNYNLVQGIYFVPIGSGLTNVVNYTLVRGNNITRNGRKHTLTLDAGIGGEPSYCIFIGNNISENYGLNIGLTGGTDNKWIGNDIMDAGFAPRFTLVLGGTYTAAVAGDLWKEVIVSGGAKGFLSSYNNGTQTWTVTITSGTFSAGNAVTITSGTGASTSVTSSTQILNQCIYIENGSRNVFESNMMGARITPSTVNYCINLNVNAVDTILRQNTMVGFTIGAILDGGTRTQDFDNLKSTDASTIANGTGLTVRTTGATVNYITATTNSSASPALTLINPSTSTITPTLRVSANVNTNFGQEPFHKAAEFLNKHADYSTDLVTMGEDGVAGAINATNGGWIGIKKGSNYRFRVKRDTVQVGAGDAAAVATVGGTLNVNTTAVGNILTGEDDLMTYSVPASTLISTGDSISITAAGRFALATVRLKAYFGVDLLFDTGSLVLGAAADWGLECEIVRTSATTQKAIVRLNTSSASLAAYADYTTPSRTLSGANIFKLTGEATLTNDVVHEFMKIRFEPA